MPIDRETHMLSAAKADVIEMTRTLAGAIAMVEQLRGGMSSRGNPNEVSQLVDALLRGLPHVGYCIPDDFTLWRGRINNDTDYFLSPKEFGSPPLEFAQGWGRCTRPGTRAFYGAMNLNTVWAELYPMVGDRVHLGKARKRQGVDSLMSEVGGIDHCRRFGRAMLGTKEGYGFFNQWLAEQSDEEAIRATLIDAYFADEFSKIVSRPRDYLVPATISSILIDAADDGGRSLLDGFAYPSVAHRGGVNFVMPPSSFEKIMEWQEFIVAEIVGYYGFGIYSYKEIATAPPPLAGEEITWITS